MKKRPMLLVVCLILSSVILYAADATPTSADSGANAPKVGQVQVEVGGARLEVDPGTGRVRALTEADALELAAHLRAMVKTRTKVSAASVANAKGLQAIRVGDDHQHVMLAYGGHAGNLHIDCVQNPEAAADHIVAASKVAQPEEK